MNQKQCSSHGSPSTVLVIGNGFQATSQSMFEHLYQRGLRTVVVADEDAWVASLVPAGVVDVLVTVPGLYDAAQTEEFASRVLQSVSDAGVARIDAVFNVFYHYLMLSARVASKLGCITNSPGAIETCIVKSKARKCLISAGLESWHSFSFHTMNELEQMATLMEYPAVLKPSESSGSYGVVRVDSPCDAIAQFSKLQAESWLQSDEAEFILENYIDGPEFGVEIIMQEGAVLFSSIMDAGKQDNSIFFQGTGRSFPSSHPLSMQESTMHHCYSAVKALGLTTGVLDIDVRYSHEHGPRIIEVNPRIGGGSVKLMHELAYGIDLIDAGLNAFLGLDMADGVAARESRSTLCFEAGWLMSPRSGVVQNTSFFTERLKSTYSHNEFVVNISSLVQDGDEVIGHETDGLPSCLIQILTSGASKSLALGNLNMVLSSAQKRIDDLVLLPKNEVAVKAINEAGLHSLPDAVGVKSPDSFPSGQRSDAESTQDSDGESLASGRHWSH